MDQHDLYKMFAYLTLGGTYIVVFLVFAMLAALPGNTVVLFFHDRMYRQITEGNRGTVSQEARRFIKAEYESAGAGWIGRTERIAYVSAIMLGLPGLITGVLILKAFFTWTDKLATDPVPAADAAGRLQNYKDIIANYHVYVAGNLISLLVGVAMGELGALSFPKVSSYVVPYVVSSVQRICGGTG